MKKKSKIISGISIIIVIIIIIFPRIKNKLLFSKNKDAHQIAYIKKNALEIKTVVITKDTIADVIRTKGILIPGEELNLSFETSGKITQIFFKEGSFVSKGELLAKVNNELLIAELQKLEAQLPLAQDRLTRQSTLYSKDAISKEAYETVFTELELLKADISLVNAKIKQTELRAPFDGIIGLRNVSEGVYVTPSTPIAQLTKISPLKLEFAVTEKQSANLHVGLPLTFTIENEDTKYHASVYAVESQLDAKTLSLKARAIYQNKDLKLKPGRSTNVEIVLQTINNAIMIPSLSTLVEMGKSYIFIVKNGKAHKIDIKKGLRTASSIQVVSGLSAGDTLITSGVMQLRDGMPVKIVSVD